MDIKLNNKEILIYICIGTSLSYIWYVSKIKLRYIFPFLIFSIIVYMRETKKNKDNINDNNKIIKIKEDLFDEDYTFLIDEDIILFINDIRIMRNFNKPVFNELLSHINDYYQHKTLSYLLRVMTTYESLYFVLPMELYDFYNQNIVLLKNILYKNLSERKLKTVEMQSYLPHNYIPSNI